MSAGASFFHVEGDGLSEHPSFSIGGKRRRNSDAKVHPFHGNFGAEKDLSAGQRNPSIIPALISLPSRFHVREFFQPPGLTIGPSDISYL